jgi:hypothetical protein
MKKDIPELKVEDMAICIAPREEFEKDDEEDLWDTYIINFKEEPIQNVLIASTGYGENDNGERLKTTTLRHFFNEIKGTTLCKVEPIPTNLFNITNEYWVSFNYNGYMYDKKYVFVVGSIDTNNFTMIPFLNRRGVMIK